MKGDLLILIDCMDFRKKPGYSEIIPLERLKGQTTNTHNISLDQVSVFFSAQVYLLGIQPKNIQFGESLSREVQHSADQIIYQINNSYH